MKKIVVFGSGNGTNAENIARYFYNSGKASVVAVISNNPSAKIIEKAARDNISSFLHSKDDFSNGQVLATLNNLKPDLIVLAGFLLKMPLEIIEFYPDKIINIHPALLPKFGGRGMYGMNVHRAVFENKERETGISIHYVDAHYDQGDIIFQTKIILTRNESPQEIATAIHALEHKYLPVVIEKLLDSHSAISRVKIELSTT